MISGVLTALITPFDANGKLDMNALGRIVDFQIEHGVDGLVPVGTTGESPTVSHEENMEIVEHVIRRAANRIPIIAGTGSNSTQEAIKMTKIAKSLGAYASLQVAPYYNKPTQEGLYRHFTTIADSVDLPMIIYNIAGRTAVNIETPTLMRIAKHPNTIGVKEASGDLSQMMDVISSKPRDFTVFAGDDGIALPLTLLGGSGVISVASNIVPRYMCQMIGAARKGNIEKARTMHYELLPLFKGLFLETNPIPVKACLAQIGLIKPVWRLPLCPPSDATTERLRDILKGQGLL
ncbi:4-hydroxy-tetrahydrodipicolinate synthase [Olavius algarvensis spirochete endosymbiont]|uniref:4-hydroxy-tetrahydrodipicolinate synthase n=1 Tax=Olavius algarvensis spirochete endosymbiont TaxID=260710 RepID=UPI000ADD8D76|nr:4-hydroxy-tetrahydrodipicolinate synthase [Olavius algarvensis spirochete endosymbiont]VDB01285.1 4-hydroxy-tetrahydrodipicolinate synthase [Olavius algarvensis spirochete endosymbiont]